MQIEHNQTTKFLTLNNAKRTEPESKIFNSAFAIKVK